MIGFKREGLNPAKNRRGMTIVELLVVVLIVSILAAIAQPMLSGVIVQARAAEVISDMEVVELAAYSYQTDQQAWPAEATSGTVPTGLASYLPDNFQLVQDGYTLDYEYWGGTPFIVGITLVTSDSILGRAALDMFRSPKWTTGDRYTWVIE